MVVFSALLLDFGLRGDEIVLPADIQKSLMPQESHLPPSDSVPIIDFPTFLQIYASKCGLDQSSTKHGTAFKAFNNFFWVPTVSGRWREVKAA